MAEREQENTAKSRMTATHSYKVIRANGDEEEEVTSPLSPQQTLALAKLFMEQGQLTKEQEQKVLEYEEELNNGTEG
jgi:hypothetical protein